MVLRQYKLLAELEEDINKLKKFLPGTYKLVHLVPGWPGIEVTISTPADFTMVQRCVELIPEGHQMRWAVNALEKYTGEEVFSPFKIIDN